MAYRKPEGLNARPANFSNDLISGTIVALDTDGSVIESTTGATRAYALVGDHSKDDKVASVQEHGTAICKVEDSSQIVAGSLLGVSNGGVEIWTSGLKFGYATEEPKNGYVTVELQNFNDFTY